MRNNIKAIYLTFSRFDGMPHSAINTGLADFILPPEQIPTELLRYHMHAHYKNSLVI